MSDPKEPDGREPSAAAGVFDALGAAYEEAFAHSAAHRASLEWLLGRLEPGSRVLDAGSGTGRPTAAALSAAGHRVTGVDVSPVMVALARERVPEADFHCADLRELPLEEGSFDALCVYFTLLTMSRRDQAAGLRRLVRAVRPGGAVAVATVAADVEDVPFVFLGQPVRATSFPADRFTEVLAEAGVRVLARQEALFTPDHPGAQPEPQLFVHGVREDEAR
ncbi:class I SAM-dependent methyltransferase [Streptomyces sp. ODS05-4]|uniref:class I SAM-dependent methyltransferase n=1 Tax=Streptomyces sp. ODS05-4 TaxID=2944939 RepID=UPI00210B546F|nr:class I SAM-dependent methyltransferase [Streptomyces sp. ODS05-4]